MALEAGERLLRIATHGPHPQQQLSNAGAAGAGPRRRPRHLGQPLRPLQRARSAPLRRGSAWRGAGVCRPLRGRRSFAADALERLGGMLGAWWGRGERRRQGRGCPQAVGRRGRGRGPSVEVARLPQRGAGEGPDGAGKATLGQSWPACPHGGLCLRNATGAGATRDTCAEGQGCADGWHHYSLARQVLDLQFQPEQEERRFHPEAGPTCPAAHRLPGRGRQRDA
mmetsp:Transcript_86836/g.230738  ORF Transcript_86836/g.230738 Transcript_86836/m.230738 type:complete len:225 (-) Transcript_86836:261-935(-)